MNTYERKCIACDGSGLPSKSEKSFCRASNLDARDAVCHHCGGTGKIRYTAARKTRRLDRHGYPVESVRVPEATQ